MGINGGTGIQFRRNVSCQLNVVRYLIQMHFVRTYMELAIDVCLVDAKEEKRGMPV
jgi:hypothetical protein